MIVHITMPFFQKFKSWIGFTSSSGYIGNTWTALSFLGLQPGFSFLVSCRFIILNLRIPTLLCPQHLQQLQSQSPSPLCPPRPPLALRAQRLRADMLLGYCCCWQCSSEYCCPCWHEQSGWWKRRHCLDWSKRSSCHRSGSGVPDLQSAWLKKWLQCPRPGPSLPENRSASHLYP